MSIFCGGESDSTSENDLGQFSIFGAVEEIFARSKACAGNSRARFAHLENPSTNLTRVTDTAYLRPEESNPARREAFALSFVDEFSL